MSDSPPPGDASEPVPERDIGPPANHCCVAPKPASASGRRARTERRICLASVVVVLPALLVALQAFGTRTQLKFLLFPPLAAIGYRLFRYPRSRAAQLRSVLVAPSLGSGLGLVLSRAGGLTSWTTAAAVVGGIAIIETLRAEAPPTLAIVLLALFAHPTWVFPASVVASTIALYTIFQVWWWVMGRLGLR